MRKNNLYGYLDVVAHFGGVVRLAKALGINHQAVYQWQGVIPEGRAWQLQVITGGAFQAKRYLLAQAVC